ncbi:NAD(P)/FAD-dependent oxidoreductase [Thermoflexibacter ruber]|uniref:Glycine/D-amino acid oxidase n=1 Tax=Thermoflexibacter ruber TaxID=1003 RepID=A0A1I2D8C2_9BACT|nr:FAD-dependent oxidoreductase [Thermoflexibacter ruber]SFE76210.1 Glycine/D-amino acid oxidase [Thermoflexibacter ruber]
MKEQATFAPRSTVETKIPRQAPLLEKSASITVIGAGAFGGWTALFLLRNGFKVTLIDAWGAGNSRSSSGDETRVTRSTYGANEAYFDLNVRALELWKTHQKLWNKSLFFNSGILWFCYEAHPPIIEDSLPFMQKHGLAYQYIPLQEAKQRFPHIYVDDLHHLVFDPYGGYLKARESCQAVQEAFVKEGGTYLQAQVSPATIKNERLENIRLSDGSIWQSHVFIFACGSWLGQIFPEVLGEVITCTKQEAYYFGVPASHAALFDGMPVWVDLDGENFYYGIPANAARGFKIGVDKRGEIFDPTCSNRFLNQEVFIKASQFISHRFPALKNAPLVENRVCPYENSPDGNFILDTHPEAGNCWFLGGGTGHGFKHAPALGELAAQIISGQKPLHPLFQMR